VIVTYSFSTEKFAQCASITLLWVLKRQENHQCVAQRYFTPEGIKQICTQRNSHIAPEMQFWPFLSAAGCRAEQHTVLERKALYRDPTHQPLGQAALLHPGWLLVCHHKLVLCWGATSCLVYLGSSFWSVQGEIV